MAFSRAAAKTGAAEDIFQNKQQFNWRADGDAADGSAGAKGGGAQMKWGSLNDLKGASAAGGISWGSVGSARAKAAGGYAPSGAPPGGVPATSSQFKAPSKAAAAPSKAPFKAAATLSKAQTDEERMLSEHKRMFEVLHKSPVRQEPHLESKKIGIKSVGARLYAHQVSMDGWLKLDREPGWILMDMRGMEELGEVVQRQEDVQIAIGGYHAQGICCCEVFFTQVAVRSAPSMSATQIGLRFKHEYVFVQSQNFDGWVKLAKEPGWMLFQSVDYGRLLEPRFDQAALSSDLHALCDVWQCARQASRRDMSVTLVKRLKELEAKCLESTYEWITELATGEPKVMTEFVEKGLLTVDDLSLPEAWLMRRLFRSAIMKLIDEDEGLKRALPDLSLSTPNPPMMVQEDPAVQAIQVDINGKLFIVGVGGILLDQETHDIVGKWNPETSALDPLPEGFDAAAGVTVFQHQGNAYLMNPEGKMLDLMLMTVVGTYNKSTQEIDPVQGEIRIDEPGWDATEAVDGIIDIPTHLQRGLEQFKKRRFHSAIREFDTALRGCEQLACCDLEVECEILTARAGCYEETGDYERLLEDAQRLLEYDDKNFDAVKWKALAMSRMRE